VPPSCCPCRPAVKILIPVQNSQVSMNRKQNKGCLLGRELAESDAPIRIEEPFPLVQGYFFSSTLRQCQSFRMLPTTKQLRSSDFFEKRPKTCKFMCVAYDPMR
jgi:hypothetical protein